MITVLVRAASLLNILWLSLQPVHWWKFWPSARSPSSRPVSPNTSVRKGDAPAEPETSESVRAKLLPSRKFEPNVMPLSLFGRSLALPAGNHPGIM